MHSNNGLPRVRNDYKNYSCPVKNAASILGDPWILFILREFIYGKKVQGFNELQSYLKPISSRTLSKKLKLLHNEGILSKKVLRKAPPKVEYSLTLKGRKAHTILKKMAHWYKENA